MSSTNFQCPPAVFDIPVGTSTTANFQSNGHDVFACTYGVGLTCYYDSFTGALVPSPTGGSEFNCASVAATQNSVSNRPKTSTDNGGAAAQTPQGDSSTQVPQQPQQSSPQSNQNIPKPPPSSTSEGSSKPTNSPSLGNSSQISNLSQTASGSQGFSQSSQRMTTSRRSETTTASSESPLASGQSLTTEIPGGNTGSGAMNPSGRTHRPAQTISIIVPIICIGVTLCILGLFVWRRQHRIRARQTLVSTIHATHGPHSDDYERDDAHARLERQSEKTFLRSPTSTFSVSVPSPSMGTAFRLPDSDLGVGADASVTAAESRDLAGARATILPNADPDIADWSEQPESKDIGGHTDAIRDRHVLNERELTVAPASALPGSRQEVSEATGLRQQNEILRNQVAHLEMQMQFERELGLAAEPPPRYAQ